MKRTIQILSALLLLQVLLALAFNYSGQDLSARGENAPLIDADLSGLDHITIEGPESAKATLAKVKGHWQLPDAGGFPADAHKVAQLIDKLKGIKLGVPVATSAGAIGRFKVGENNFERRIRLSGGGRTLAELYFGSTQRAHEINARRGDRKEVFAVDFATFEAPVDAKDWEDKEVLQVPKADIAGIEVAGLKLKPQHAAKDDKPAAKPGWQAEGLEAGEVLNADAVDKLADLLVNLRIGDVLGSEDKPDYGLDKPALSLGMERKAKEGNVRIDYRIGKMADGSAYVLKASTRSEYLRLPTYTAEQLINAAKRETLLGTSTASGKSAGPP